MEYFPFEIFDPWNVGPFPCIENPSSVEENMTPVTDSPPCLEVGDLDFPMAAFIVPFCTRDQLSELTVFTQIVLVGEANEIFQDFIRPRIRGRPVRVRFERPGICMSSNVAGATAILYVSICGVKFKSWKLSPRIFVFEPCSTNVLVFVVQRQIKVLE
jgi:hypothetical protein